jgi:hypothetical protein
VEEAEELFLEEAVRFFGVEVLAEADSVEEDLAAVGVLVALVAAAPVVAVRAEVGNLIQLKKINSSNT